MIAITRGNAKTFGDFSGGVENLLPSKTVSCLALCFIYCVLKGYRFLLKLYNLLCIRDCMRFGRNQRTLFPGSHLILFGQLNSVTIRLCIYTSLK